jgi:hypothetical protein
MNDKEKRPEWITGWHANLAGTFPIVSTRLSFKDKLSGFRVHWGIGRMKYRIYPGLYVVGTPDADSPVLVTANYKLSFDSLRKHLAGINAWVLVLDTKGVNVWCAAGKGTFGTEELIRRVTSANLSLVVRHRTLILPQLSAPGVAAHVVTDATGFKVVYGPIRAADVPRFLENGMKADQAMRAVSFSLKERLTVIPVELVQSWKIVLPAFLFHLFSSYATGNISPWSTFFGFLPYIGAILVGCVLVPLMLPWIPGRSLAFKGWLAGIIATIVYNLLDKHQSAENIMYLLVLPAISSFLALNFTGATPFTSLSGVRKEMRFAIPLLIFSAVLGIVLYIFRLWRIPWSML